MSAPPISDAAVAIAAGKILDLGKSRELRQKHASLPVTDLGDAVLLPGLINAHTHLELSHIRRGDPGKNLADWIVQTVLPQTPRPGQATTEAVEKAVKIGVEQCLRFGVTCVGDISKQCAQTRPLLRGGPLRVVSYGEIQAMAKRRGLLEERFALAADVSQDSPLLRVGVTPHAPYTVEPQGYRRCLEFARATQRPIATHLAETADEAEFLAKHTGAFRRLWEVGVNAWDDDVPKFSGGPIRFAHELGLFDYTTLLAHVNYCDDAELEILAGSNASVVYCPRTHEFFGHRPHRWREMLRLGINVAVGTDSCASSPDLNLVDELRLLHRLAPEIPVETLWQMATTRAARAVNLSHIGSIDRGNHADLAAFACRTSDPLREILENEVLPASVWIGGCPPRGLGESA